MKIYPGPPAIEMRVHKLKSKQALLIAGMVSIVIACQCTKRDSYVTGGPCSYARYPGTLVVKSIERDEQATDVLNPDVQSVLVSVEFTADADSGATHGASMTNTVSITPREAEAKDVKVGRQFRAYSMRLTKGTCNPGPYLAAFTEWK